MSFREKYEKMINDKFRPGYHFAAPGIDAYPGDPNGAFYADGEYHLMYLYRNHDTEGFHWGHMWSRDLLEYDEKAYNIGAFSGKEEIEEAPFELKDDEKLYMDIFVDKSVIEVYVNERQAIGRRIYIEGDNANEIYALSDGSEFSSVRVAGLTSTNSF